MVWAKYSSIKCLDALGCGCKRSSTTKHVGQAVKGARLTEDGLNSGGLQKNGADDSSVHPTRRQGLHPAMA